MVCAEPPMRSDTSEPPHTRLFFFSSAHNSNSNRNSNSNSNNNSNSNSNRVAPPFPLPSKMRFFLTMLSAILYNYVSKLFLTRKDEGSSRFFYLRVP